MTVKVYDVRFDTDFQYFLLSDRAQVAHLTFDGTPISKWSPPKVFSYKPHLPEGDFWSVELGLGIFAATPEVANDAWHLLQDAGQLLPLPYGDRVFQVLNVTETVNCLDHGRSEIITSPTTGGFMRVERYAFHVDRLPESSVFKIPETRRSMVYCYEGLKGPDDELKSYVEQRRLRGLSFTEIWSADH